MAKKISPIVGLFWLATSANLLCDLDDFNFAVFLAVTSLFVDALLGMVANHADFITFHLFGDDLGRNLDAAYRRGADSGFVTVDNE